MIGSIIGDIVGSVYEFTPHNIKTKEFELFSPVGSYTDDSIHEIMDALLGKPGTPERDAFNREAKTNLDVDKYEKSTIKRSYR